MRDPFDIVCDHCGTPLLIHGETFAGQLCDFQLSLKDLRRVLREEWQATKARWHI